MPWDKGYKIRSNIKKKIYNHWYSDVISNDNKSIVIKNCQLPLINQIVGKTYQNNLYKTFDVIFSRENQCTINKEMWLNK